MLVGVVNAAKIVKLRRDELLRTSLLDCDVILADGQSVVWASRLLRHARSPNASPVSTSSSASWSSPTAITCGSTFSGHARGAARARSAVSGALPRVFIAGAPTATSPTDEAAAVAADIRGSDADMLFLG